MDHKIEVANMDGNGRRLLVSIGLHWPNGLTLDQATNRLFWVDAGQNTMEFFDLEGHTRTTLLLSSFLLPHPFGLTLLEDHLYLTDWEWKVVFQTERNPQFFTALVQNLGQPMDIHAYDKNQTLPGKNIKNKISLRGRRSKGKGEGEFEREARSRSWDCHHPPPRLPPPTTHPHDRASRSLSRFALELPFSLPLRTPATQAKTKSKNIKTQSFNCGSLSYTYFLSLRKQIAQA